MSDPSFYLIMATAALAGLAMLISASLAGWRGWLRLKEQELRQDADARTPAPTSASARIEIADLRERIRKLEAIAAGVDL
ncbi:MULTISPECIES: hypothetical protein [unclassified Sphingomonas]|uniref:hypothetical protein n=1 Tax=unclassified Sphingomonas TaxID=196159 RepID=UPI001D12FDFC|nr:MULTISPECIES: hypothetical protein [unclassified Sphingomonas]MCC2979576.1 hypothetical protein [Sphingomonas sp. IC4-52]MCD2315194.1 hypothetical protein [Sphingomonas sp. IC-11]